VQRMQVEDVCLQLCDLYDAADAALGDAVAPPASLAASAQVTSAGVYHPYHQHSQLQHHHPYTVGSGGGMDESTGLPRPQLSVSTNGHAAGYFYPSPGPGGPSALSASSYAASPAGTANPSSYFSSVPFAPASPFTYPRPAHAVTGSMASAPSSSSSSFAIPTFATPGPPRQI
jgi:hypothetical protein